MVATLKEEVKNRDQTIQVLQGEVSQLHTRLDDLEQHGRRDSIRIFGLPEEAPGTTDEKVLKLVNGRMKLQPPLALQEISVSHRDGQQSDDGENQDNTRPRPRPLLVKFTSRRSKERVMTARKSPASRMLTKSLMTTMSPRTATTKTARTFHSTASLFTWVTTWRRRGPSLLMRPELHNAKVWSRAHGLPIGKLLSWILVITSKR